MTSEQDVPREPAQQLREEARKLLDLIDGTPDPGKRRGLARRAFVLLQQAEGLRRLD